jgi:diketogulonate reductase-like aldo/keto reductase
MLQPEPTSGRSELFVTSKVLQYGATSLGDVAGACRASLAKLQLEYLDLYLIHAPFFESPTCVLSNCRRQQQQRRRRQ